ncbi:MAG: HEAT repeat domain-containing protein [Spirochaetia bacterium]
MKYNTILLVLILFLLQTPLFSQSDDSDDEEDEEVQSIVQEWRETILYGIDSQIIELIDTLESEREMALNNELEELFQQTGNSELREKILSFFLAIDYSEAVDLPVQVLQTYEYFNESDSRLYLASISYIADNEIATDQTRELLMNVSELEHEAVASAAIRALGTIGNESTVEHLFELFDDYDITDEIKSNIILAFGEIQTEDALFLLIDILDNPHEEAIWRRFSCTSLGMIGNPEAIDPLVEAYREGDAMLRAYAIAALGEFSEDRVIPVILQAMRDSNARVRLAASEALRREDAEEAVPMLQYKVERDPEESVRRSAIETLAQIHSSQAIEYLHEYLLDDDKPDHLREVIVRSLINNDLSDSIPIFEQLLENVWEEDESRLREVLCRYLSLEEASGLQDIFALMLDHSEFTIQIHGLRGIRRNRFSSLKPRVENFTSEEYHPMVRRTALAALEEL